MIKVSPRAKVHTDRAGDPLDGLVNMFDLGIVLAVAFLIAALQSVNLTRVLTKRSSVNAASSTLTLRRDQRLAPLKPGTVRVPVSPGGSVGSVYRLPDGRLVYVARK